MLKERERLLKLKRTPLLFFSSSLESLQAMDKQTWSHHIPQSLSYQVSAGDMCGNLLAIFTRNCTDFHRLRDRIHHRLPLEECGLIFVLVSSTLASYRTPFN
jgi:hypothetical protein